MPSYKARRKAPKAQQLTGPLQGELGTYRRFGLYQRALGKRSVYRYTGVLLIYQRALSGREPTLETSKLFLARLREDGFDPNTLKVYRAALQGFHQWRGESLVFPIKVPHRQPRYVEPQLPATMLRLAQDNPRDVLIIRLMTEAGLRRGEVPSLKVGEVGEDALRIRGKGGRERTIPDLPP